MYSSLFGHAGRKEAVFHPMQSAFGFLEATDCKCIDLLHAGFLFEEVLLWYQLAIVGGGRSRMAAAAAVV